MFYPKGLPARQMLRFYGERFRTVEINNTFYRMPKTTVVEAWVSEVPSEFQFVLKASRRITHLRRLEDVEESLSMLIRVSGALKQRLGPLLFQLPPPSVPIMSETVPLYSFSVEGGEEIIPWHMQR